MLKIFDDGQNEREKNNETKILISILSVCSNVANKVSYLMQTLLNKYFAEQHGTGFFLLSGAVCITNDGRVDQW